jgi:hypothetical protein
MMEEEEDEMDARLAVVEGKVTGVVKEARQWNKREQVKIEKEKKSKKTSLKLQSLFVVVDRNFFFCCFLKKIFFVKRIC